MNILNGIPTISGDNKSKQSAIIGKDIIPIQYNGTNLDSMIYNTLLNMPIGTAIVYRTNNEELDSDFKVMCLISGPNVSFAIYTMGSHTLASINKIIDDDAKQYSHKGLAPSKIKYYTYNTANNNLQKPRTIKKSNNHNIRKTKKKSEYEQKCGNLKYKKQPSSKNLKNFYKKIILKKDKNVKDTKEIYKILKLAVRLEKYLNVINSNNGIIKLLKYNNYNTNIIPLTLNDILEKDIPTSEEINIAITGAIAKAKSNKNQYFINLYNKSKNVINKFLHNLTKITPENKNDIVSTYNIIKEQYDLCYAGQENNKSSLKTNKENLTKWGISFNNLNNDEIFTLYNNTYKKVQTLLKEYHSITDDNRYLKDNKLYNFIDTTIEHMEELLQNAKNSKQKRNNMTQHIKKITQTWPDDWDNLFKLPDINLLMKDLYSTCNELNNNIVLTNNDMKDLQDYKNITPITNSVIEEIKNKKDKNAKNNDIENAIREINNIKNQYNNLRKEWQHRVKCKANMLNKLNTLDIKTLPFNEIIYIINTKHKELNGSSDSQYIILAYNIIKFVNYIYNNIDKITPNNNNRYNLQNIKIWINGSINNNNNNKNILKNVITNNDIKKITNSEGANKKEIIFNNFGRNKDYAMDIINEFITYIETETNKNMLSTAYNLAIKYGKKKIRNELKHSINNTETTEINKKHGEGLALLEKIRKKPNDIVTEERNIGSNLKFSFTFAGKQ